jgi:magnesium transporter
MPSLRAFSSEELLRLPRDAAARVSTSKVPLIGPHESAGHARDVLQQTIGDYESAHYIYIADEWGMLIGVMSLRELYAADPSHTMGELCKREKLVTIRPEEDQERAAYLALRHRIKAIPVVDDDRRLTGVITSDVILRILYKELHDDLLRMAGVHHEGSLDDILHMPLRLSIRHRLPWLAIGLVGGLGAASVVGLFEETLREHLILAGFIPLIVYMASAVGTQTQTFIIRDLAIDHQLKIGPYLWRQAMVTGVLAVIFGVATTAFGLLAYGDGRLGWVLGLSMVAAIGSSIISGALVPYALSLLRMDPANAGGPISTIIQDILSILIYFSVATWMLG